MNDAPDYRRLLRQTLLALLVCASLVVLCFFFVDRPVVFAVHDRHINRDSFLKWFTYPPPILQSFTPLVFAILVVRRAWGPFKRCERTLLAASVGIILAEQFKDGLALVFGRYWPDTWVKNNPSLLGNGAYGFNPFQTKPWHEWYRSFPSGHTARTLAVVAPIWIGYRQLRWLCVLAAAAVVVGLIGMNYHFVSDIIAGGFIGGIIGTYTAHFCGLANLPEATRTQPIDI